MTVDDFLKNRTIQKQKIANNSEAIKKDFIKRILGYRENIREKCESYDLEDDEIYDLVMLRGIELGIEFAYITVFGVSAFTDLMTMIINSELVKDE